MAGEVYGSPGSAFTYGIDDFLINQQKLEHQKLMDSLDAQREKRLEQQDNLDLQIKQAELEDRKAVNAQTILGKKVESVQKRADELAPGDIPSAQLIHDAQEIGYPLRLGAAPTMATVPAGQQAPQMPGGGTAPFGPAMTAPEQAITDPSQRPFLGTPKQQQLDALMGTLTSADPSSPEFKKAAIQYELVSGRSLPAAAFTPTKTTTAKQPELGTFGDYLYRVSKGNPDALSPQDVEKARQKWGEEARAPQTPTPILQIGPDGTVSQIGTAAHGARIVRAPISAQKLNDLTPTQRAAFNAAVKNMEAHNKGLLAEISGNDMTDEEIFEKAYEEAKKIPGATTPGTMPPAASHTQTPSAVDILNSR